MAFIFCFSGDREPSPVSLQNVITYNETEKMFDILENYLEVARKNQ